VPIKLNIQCEGKKLQEKFLWDKNEPYMTLESFAKLLVEENSLPLTSENEILSQMKKQIQSWKPFKPLLQQTSLLEREQALPTTEIVRTIRLNVRVGNVVLRD